MASRPMASLFGSIRRRGGAGNGRAQTSAGVVRSVAKVLAAAVLGGALMLSTAATVTVQQAQDSTFVASALGVPVGSVQIDGTLTVVSAADARLFRVGEGAPSATPGIVIEKGAHATITWAGRPSEHFGSGGALDCARPTVACPATELRVERFDTGGQLLLWSLAGAIQRPPEGQTLRIAVLAYDPRFPRVNDTRPNSPFVGANKIWVLDLTASTETVRYFQVEGGQFREFRSDAIAGFSTNFGFTFIAPQAFDGVTEWNIHTYSLAGAEEGGHALVPPGGAMLPVTGPAIQITPAPPEPCAPRPAVGVAVTAPGGGVLEVTVTTTSGIASLQIGDGPNWKIEPALPLQIAPGATEVTFQVRRTGDGAVHVPFTVTDGCGAWPTFVGGGPSAF